MLQNILMVYEDNMTSVGPLFFMLLQKPGKFLEANWTTTTELRILFKTKETFDFCLDTTSNGGNIILTEIFKTYDEICHILTFIQWSLI